MKTKTELYSVTIVAAPDLKNDRDKVFLFASALVIYLKPVPTPSGLSKIAITAGESERLQTLENHSQAALTLLYPLADDFACVESLHEFWKFNLGIRPLPLFFQAITDTEILDSVAKSLAGKELKEGWEWMQDLFYSVDCEAIRYKLGLPI